MWSLAIALGAAVVVLASLPYWLPRLVVAVRMWLFARINGAEGIAVPGDLVDVSQFLEVYAHPAAGGRSRGAALSDLFWYWLSPGAEVHQEHLERGPRYDEVARCTRASCRCRAGRRASRRRVRARGAAGPDRSRPATRPGDAGLGRVLPPAGLRWPRHRTRSGS